MTAALPSADRILARWLFGLAAAFNALVGLGLLFARPQLSALVNLDPIAGSNLALLYLTAAFILLFAYSYALVARDPVRYRPFIGFAVIGKLMAVAAIATPWLAGQMSWKLPALASGDLVFAGLFLWFLRKVPALVS